MSRNLVTVDEIVNDFILSLSGDDYCSDVNDTIVRNYALRGIREIGFDMSKVVRSLKMPVNHSLQSVDLPDDFVDLVKIGVVGADGLVYVFGENKNINISQIYKTNAAGNYITGTDGLYEREDADAREAAYQSIYGYETYLFRNFLDNDSYGALYGLGGGNYAGEYRMDYDQNRIELNGIDGVDYVVIEYIADEARSANPSVHIYAESAIRAYIYYKVIERKSSVPSVEKNRARAEYYNERRLANSRLKSFNMTEALKVIRKNFKQSPKY
jgi:hypothetical protein